MESKKWVSEEGEAGKESAFFRKSREIPYPIPNRKNGSPSHNPKNRNGARPSEVGNS